MVIFQISFLSVNFLIDTFVKILYITKFDKSTKILEVNLYAFPYRNLHETVCRQMQIY